MPKPPALIRAITDPVDVGFAGERPWDLQVHNPAIYGDLLRRGSLALGEAYVRGDWDCEALDQLFTRLLGSPGSRQVSGGFLPHAQLLSALRCQAEHWMNWQTRQRSTRVARQHYDIDHRVYAATLDSRLIYSCAHWQHADDLETAQLHKLQRICQKLELSPGMRLLDVGCGWGALAAFAAATYGVEVVGITLSQKQADFCRTHFGDQFDVVLCDYRSEQLREMGSFDRIVSIGMLEHVGRKNDRRYFETLSRLLNPDGLILIQTIGSHDTNDALDPWIDTYIFPGGRLPSAQQLSTGFEDRFLLQDWENFGFDYDRTLMAWWQNFEQSWPALQAQLQPSFDRFWRYYLLCCAGFFRSGQGQLWQLVLSPKASPRSYRSSRPRLCELGDPVAAVAL